MRINYSVVPAGAPGFRLGGTSRVDGPRAMRTFRPRPPLSASKVRTHAVALTHALATYIPTRRGTHARMRTRCKKKKTEKRNPDRRRAGPRWDSVGRRAARFGRGRFFPDRQIRRDSSVPLRHRAHTCAYIPFVPRTSGVHRLSARPGRKTDAGRSLTVSPIVHAACPPQMASRSTRSPVFVIAFHLKAYELIRAPVDESDVVRRVLKGDGDNVNAL